MKFERRILRQAGAKYTALLASALSAGLYARVFTGDPQQWLIVSIPVGMFAFWRLGLIGEKYARIDPYEDPVRHAAQQARQKRAAARRARREQADRAKGATGWDGWRMTPEPIQTGNTGPYSFEAEWRGKRRRFFRVGSVYIDETTWCAYSESSRFDAEVRAYDEINALDEEKYRVDEAVTPQ